MRNTVNEYASSSAYGGGPSPGYSGAGGGSPGSDYTSNPTSMADAAAASVTGSYYVAGVPVAAYGSADAFAAVQAATAASAASVAAGGSAQNFNPVGSAAWYASELAYGGVTTAQVGSPEWWNYQIGVREAAALSNTVITPISKSSPGYYEYYASVAPIGTQQWYQQVVEAKQYNPSSLLAQTQITPATPGFYENIYGGLTPGSKDWYNAVIYGSVAGKNIANQYSINNPSLSILPGLNARSDFVPFGMLGDTKTQQLISQGYSPLQALNKQIQEAYATPDTRDEKFYINELARASENYIATSSQYHAKAKETGLPQPVNPYEYVGDLALGFLKGYGEQQTTPVNLSILNLPSGKGIQEVQWENAKGGNLQPNWYTPISVIDTARELGTMGPYGNLGSWSSTLGVLSVQQQQGIATQAAKTAGWEIIPAIMNVDERTSLGYGVGLSTFYQAASKQAAAPVSAPSGLEIGKTGTYVIPESAQVFGTGGGIPMVPGSYSYNEKIISPSAPSIENFALNFGANVLNTLSLGMINLPTTAGFEKKEVTEKYSIELPAPFISNVSNAPKDYVDYVSAPIQMDMSKTYQKADQSVWDYANAMASNAFPKPSIETIDKVAKQEGVSGYLENLALGGYMSLSERPLEPVKYASIGALFVAGGEVVSGAALAVSAGTKAAPIVSSALSVIPTALTALYGFNVAERSTEGFKEFGTPAAYNLGGIATTEAIPMFAGGYLYSGSGRTTSVKESGYNVYSDIRSGIGKTGEDISNRLFALRQSASGIENVGPRSGLSYYIEQKPSVERNFGTSEYAKNKAEYPRGGEIGYFLDTVPSDWFKGANAQKPFEYTPVPDYMRYADLESRLNSFYMLQEPVRSLSTSPSIIGTSRTTKTSVELTPDYIKLAQTEPSGRSSSLTFEKGKMGDFASASGEAWTFSDVGSKIVTRVEDITINPFSGTTMIVGSKTTSFTPSSGKSQIERYADVFNIYNLPPSVEIASSESAKSFEIPTEGLKEVSFSMGEKGTTASRVLKNFGEITQSGRTYGISPEGFVSPMTQKARTSEINRVFEDLIQSERPESLSLTSYRKPTTKEEVKTYIPEFRLPEAGMREVKITKKKNEKENISRGIGIMQDFYKPTTSERLQATLQSMFGELSPKAKPLQKSMELKMEEARIFKQNTIERNTRMFAEPYVSERTAQSLSNVYGVPSTEVQSIQKQTGYSGSFSKEARPSVVGIVSGVGGATKQRSTPLIINAPSRAEENAAFNLITGISSDINKNKTKLNEGEANKSNEKQRERVYPLERNIPKEKTKSIQWVIPGIDTTQKPIPKQTTDIISRPIPPSIPYIEVPPIVRPVPTRIPTPFKIPPFGFTGGGGSGGGGGRRYIKFQERFYPGEGINFRAFQGRAIAPQRRDARRKRR